MVTATGEVTTIAGAANVSDHKDGRGTAARFEMPLSLAYDGAGNLFVADEAGQESDVDVLVDFEVGPTFDSFLGLKLYLEDRLGNRVDLVTRAALKPRMRPVVAR